MLPFSPPAAGWVQTNLPKCLTHVHTFFFFKLSLWTKHWEGPRVKRVRHQDSTSSCFGFVKMKTLDINWQVNKIMCRITRCQMLESSWSSQSHHIQELTDFLKITCKLKISRKIPSFTAPFLLVYHGWAEFKSNCTTLVLLGLATTSALAAKGTLSTQNALLVFGEAKRNVGWLLAYVCLYFLL